MPRRPTYTPHAAQAAGTIPVSIPLEEMSPDEARHWFVALRDKLRAKQQREWAYLDRRAGRCVHTPTDDAYHADQALETELLVLLDHLITHVAEP
jgi:hypothetical protein